MLVSIIDTIQRTVLLRALYEIAGAANCHRILRNWEFIRDFCFDKDYTPRDMFVRLPTVGAWAWIRRITELQTSYLSPWKILHISHDVRTMVAFGSHLASSTSPIEELGPFH